MAFALNAKYLFLICLHIAILIENLTEYQPCSKSIDSLFQTAALFATLTSIFNCCSLKIVLAEQIKTQHVLIHLLQLNMLVYTHCVKSVQIRSFFCSVFSCVQTEYRKIETRKKTTYLDTFHAVAVPK